MKLRLESAIAKQRLLWVTAGVLWLGAVGTGWTLLAGYANSPSSMQNAPAQWPSRSELKLTDHGATLVMFAHPRCPCTRAGLGELEKIIAHYQGEVTAWVVFFKPAGAQENWDQTDLWKTAAAIPGVHVVRDLDGQEARCFHAATSGQTFLYGDRGNLLFSGGITFARGHSGDNDGRASIESYLSDRRPGPRESPVFGCPIISTLEEK